MLVDLIKRVLIYILVICATPLAFADSSFDEDKYFSDRGLASITEYIPSKEAFRCEPRCGGPSQCGQFTDIDQCLEPSNKNACFWSCEE